MMRLGVWQMAGEGPQRLQSTEISLERDLEDWIERDPSLVQHGLTIIGRQIRTDSGPLDLLALDPQGKWCVIEIKRGTLDRVTMAQVQDYAACLAEMTGEELKERIDPYLIPRGSDLRRLLSERDALDSLDPVERELVMFVVGTAQASGLDRMIRFLSDRQGVSITAILFSTFTTSAGEQILLREIPDTEGTDRIDPQKTPSLEQLRSVAEEGKMGGVFDRLLEAGKCLGLYPRPWKTSVMMAPRNDRRRCLYVFWVKPGREGLKTYVEVPAFSEFYDVSEERAREVLGETGYQQIDEAGAEELASALQELLGDVVEMDQ